MSSGAFSARLSSRIVAGLAGVALALACLPLAAMEPITIRGDSFYAGDVPFRIWGVNVMYGLHLSDKQLRQNMDRLEFLGVNMVRLHALDVTAWGSDDWSAGLIEYRDDTSRKLTNITGFFRLIDALRDKDIYFCINLLMARIYRPGDSNILQTTPDDKRAWEEAIRELRNLPRGLRMSVQKFLPAIDERSLALTEEYASNLLDLRHPSTGRRLAERNQFALLETVNEWHGYKLMAKPKYWNACPKYFQAKLLGRWNTYLRAKYGSHEKLRAAWQETGRWGIRKGEHLEKGTVQFAPFESHRDSASSARYNDLLTFLGSLDMNLQRNMRDLYRTRGYDGPTIYSYIDSLHGGLYRRWEASGLYPYYEDHNYDHSMDNLFRTPALDAARLVSCTQRDTVQYAWNKPYWRSETRCDHWSRIANPMVTATFFSLTGIDGVTFFCWDLHRQRTWYDTLQPRTDRVNQYHLLKDLVWQLAFRAAGRLYCSRQIDPLPLNDPRRNRLARDSDIRTPQVIRSANDGILLVRTKDFLTVATDHPFHKRYDDIEINITSNVCNVLTIEWINGDTLEITALGQYGDSFTKSTRQNWMPQTFVTGTISFPKRQIEKIIHLDELGRTTSQNPAEGNTLPLVKPIRLYRVLLKPLFKRHIRP